MYVYILSLAVYKFVDCMLRCFKFLDGDVCVCCSVLSGIQVVRICQEFYTIILYFQTYILLLCVSVGSVMRHYSEFTITSTVTQST